MTNGVIILGGGSTGEACVSALRELEPDTPITLVERELVGGECSYFACMPTKGMLRPLEAVAAARNVPGAAEAVTGSVSAERLFFHRDSITGGWDDTSQAEWLESKGAELVRGEGRVVRPGVVSVGERELGYDRLVIATGSVPAIPPIPGLDEIEYWTNREATTTREIPHSMIVLGAGPVGCELAQFFSRMGSRVSIVDMAERLLPRDDAAAGELLAEMLSGEGIELHLGAGVERLEPGVQLHLAGGGMVRGDRLLVATGRRPNTEGFGFEQLGVTISKQRHRGRRVDVRGRRRVGDRRRERDRDVHPRRQVPGPCRRNAWPAAKREADHRAVPAVTFTDPQVASVGVQGGEGLVTGERAIDKVAAHLDL